MQIIIQPVDVSKGPAKLNLTDVSEELSENLRALIGGHRSNIKPNTEEYTYVCFGTDGFVPDLQDPLHAGSVQQYTEDGWLWTTPVYQKPLCWPELYALEDFFKLPSNAFEHGHMDMLNYLGAVTCFAIPTSLIYQAKNERSTIYPSDIYKWFSGTEDSKRQSLNAISHARMRLGHVLGSIKDLAFEDKVKKVPLGCGDGKTTDNLCIRTDYNFYRALANARKSAPSAQERLRRASDCYAPVMDANEEREAILIPKRLHREIILVGYVMLSPRTDNSLLPGISTYEDLINLYNVRKKALKYLIPDGNSSQSILTKPQAVLATLSLVAAAGAGVTTLRSRRR